MKRNIVFGIMMALVVGLHAQTESSADTIAASVGCQEESSSSFSLQLGISAGSTLYFNNNDHSPYYSKYGFNVQIPLLASWQLTPHWKLSTGLRYDFVWEPLYYAVEPAGTNHDDLFDRGLQFLTSTQPSTYKQYAFHSYVGIPVEIKWYPWPESKGTLAIGVDFFAGLAVSQYFDLETIHHQSDGTFSYEGYGRDSFNAMNPWKMELGLSFSTDILGIVHGIRLFSNLLPTYKDPVSGQKIYTAGVTYFF